MIGEPRGRDTEKDGRRRGLLVLPPLLHAFAPGGLSVELRRGEPKAGPQGTQSVPSSSAPAPSASGIQVVGGEEAILSPVPTVLGSGDDVTLTNTPRAPQISLLNLPGSNQDVCKNKSVALTYSGSTHS